MRKAKFFVGSQCGKARPFFSWYKYIEQNAYSVKGDGIGAQKNPDFLHGHKHALTFKLICFLISHILRIQCINKRG